MLDLLFADAVLGDGSGPAVTEPHPGDPTRMDVLYASGYTGHRLFVRDPWEHVTHVIRKPYSSMALLEKVRDILDLRRCIKIA